MYDQLGEEGLNLKMGTPSPSGSCSSRTRHASSTGFSFDVKSGSNDLFMGLFGFPNPFGGMEHMADSRAAAYSFSDGLLGDNISPSLRHGVGLGSNYMRKGATIEKALLCSLEELYMGCVKKMKIARDAIDNTGLVTARLFSALIYL